MWSLDYNQVEKKHNSDNISWKKEDENKFFSENYNADLCSSISSQTSSSTTKPSDNSKQTDSQNDALKQSRCVSSADSECESTSNVLNEMDIEINHGVDLANQNEIEAKNINSPSEIEDEFVYINSNQFSESNKSLNKNTLKPG